MELRSRMMNLSRQERRWLPWLGKTGKLAMGWSCFLNRSRYPVVERTFEGIAGTRRKILIQWAEGHWEFLGRLAAQLADGFPAAAPDALQEKRRQAPDFSELFVIDTAGRVLASTCAEHTGKTDLPPRAVAEGLRAPFLHGPYVDRLTETIGPSTSKFHDEVTLMFYQPILKDGKAVGCLCGRIPNDVMSDLIQREAGHVYRDSGDNYIFMVEPRFDPGVKPGTALSRSRFEDDSFTLDDNLRQGVRTRFGTVKISKHTELELQFTDPATQQLHPGVRETIRSGENLFVTYPGYPDYRHIPVIGKGVTFQLPGSPDRWGMMCEGDLEEVYRQRSLAFTLTRLVIVISAGAWGLPVALEKLIPMGATAMQFVVGLALLSGIGLFYSLGLRPVMARLNSLSEFFLQIAECGGTLKQRLALDRFRNDESGELARWINSFVDKIDDTVEQVLGVASRVATASADLAKISTQVAEGSRRQNHSAAGAAAAVEQMTASIEHVAQQANATEETSRAASELSEQGRGVVQSASGEMTKIANSINTSSQLIQRLEERSGNISAITNMIRNIADQTNLLALNAAIEAARAGEQGRGFAVVADEVRVLAARTSTATTEITQMIESILAETNGAAANMESCSRQAQQGVELAIKAGSSLDQINAGANRTLEMVRDIAGATKQQTVASGEIAQNVEKIAQMARHNDAGVTQATRSANNLEQLASDLQKAVSRFTG